MTVKRPDPLRAELFFGAVYGLGLSSIIWASVLFPPPAEPATVAVLALALASGLVRPRAPWIGRFSPVLAVALAALALGGVAAGVIAASTASLVAGLSEGGGRDGMRPRHATFRAVAVAMAAFIAGLAYVATGGPVGVAVGRGHLLGALVHAIAFLAVHRMLLSLATANSDAFTLRRPKLAPVWRYPLAALGSPVLALVGVTVFRVDGLRTGILITIAIALVYRLGRHRAPGRSTGRSRRDRSLALRGAITRTLTKAIAGGDRAVEGQL